MESVRVIVEANDPAARIALAGASLASGVKSNPLPLSCGRNLFSGAVTAADGSARTEFSFKVFRAYPHLGWRRVASSTPWAPRDSAGELVFRDRLWLLGGYIPATTNDVWSSADGLNWTREADVPTTRGIDIPVAFVLNDRMWVSDLDGTLYASEDGRSWSLVTADAPWRGRGSAGCVVFDGRVWVMGGMKDGALLNDVWCSSDGVRWSLVTAHAPWPARQITHTPVALNGRMWLLGGGALRSDYYPFVAWNDVWSSADGAHWERVVEHAPWVPRIWGSSVVHHGRMWLLGGFRSEPTWENLGDVWYSADGASWRQLETVPTLRHSGARNVPFVVPDSVWAPRHEHSVYSLHGALWVVGGMVWPLMNDVWRLDIPGICFLTQPVVETYVGGLYEYVACADFNRSGRRVAYRLQRGPDWLSLDPITGALRGVAPCPGDHEVCLEAGGDAGESARQEFTLHTLS
jgi:hypothetical protein